MNETSLNLLQTVLDLVKACKLEFWIHYRYLKSCLNLMKEDLGMNQMYKCQTGPDFSEMGHYKLLDLTFFLWTRKFH